MLTKPEAASFPSEILHKLPKRRMKEQKKNMWPSIATWRTFWILSEKLSFIWNSIRMPSSQDSVSNSVFGRQFHQKVIETSFIQSTAIAFHLKISNSSAQANTLAMRWDEWRCNSIDDCCVDSCLKALCMSNGPSCGINTKLVCHNIHKLQRHYIIIWNVIEIQWKRICQMGAKATAR